MEQKIRWRQVGHTAKTKCATCDVVLCNQQRFKCFDLYHTAPVVHHTPRPSRGKRPSAAQAAAAAAAQDGPEDGAPAPGLAQPQPSKRHRAAQ